MFSECQFLVKDGVVVFSGIPQGVPANSEYSQELWLNDVDNCGHQTLKCPSISYIVPSKISPSLPLCRLILWQIMPR